MSKQTQDNPNVPQSEQDDALFQALSQSKKAGLPLHPHSGRKNYGGEQIMLSLKMALRSIGANKMRAVLTMEAVVLCMMGCCLGIFLSWAILQIVNTVVASLDMVFHLNLGVVLVAVAFCFVIGLVFGLYPANKAAKMKPIDALHYGG